MIIAVVTVAILISAIVSYQLNKTYYIGYRESGNIDYDVYLKENEFFDSPHLESNQSYVASLIDKIITNFNYEIDMDTDDVNYKYSYKITSRLEIIDDNSKVAIFNPERELVNVQNKAQSSSKQLRINEIVMLLLTDSALPEKAAAASKKRITEILKYVRENLSEPITVEAIAGVFHLNHDYFSRSFIKETGKSFHEYLTCLRIDLAKKILKTNECDIQIVAQTCGFSSASHFVQVFKKVTGYTPAKYRKLDI